jgi:hypothetical protein
VTVLFGGEMLLAQLMHCFLHGQGHGEVRLIADLVEDWRRLNDRIATVSAEIEALRPRRPVPDLLDMAAAT